MIEHETEERLSREAAAAKLHALADELDRHNEVSFENDGHRFTGDVPDEVTYKLEIEVGESNEIEIEISWGSEPRPAAALLGAAGRGVGAGLPVPDGLDVAEGADALGGQPAAVARREPAAEGQLGVRGGHAVDEHGDGDHLVDEALRLRGISGDHVIAVAEVGGVGHPAAGVMV